MRVRTSVLLVALLVALPAAGGVTTSHATKRVERVLASPVPPGLVLDDAVSWRLVVPDGVVVCVDAHEEGAAPFRLLWDEGGSPVPSFAQSVLLGPGTWTLTLDPVAGADVDVVVELRGAFVDCVNRAPAKFELDDVASRGACLTDAGVCLP